MITWWFRGERISCRLHAFSIFLPCKCIKTTFNCDFCSHSSRYRTTNSIAFRQIEARNWKTYKKKPKCWRVFEIVIRSMNLLPLRRFSSIWIWYDNCCLFISFPPDHPVFALALIRCTRSVYNCFTNLNCFSNSVFFLLHFAIISLAFTNVNVCKFVVGDRILYSFIVQ